MASNILVVGGSRHIGYHASLRFLAIGSVVTFLLRSPAVFDADEEIQKYVKTGHARLVKGDALVIEDVRNVWAEASKDKPVDLFLFTVGFTGTPKFHLSKGFTISPGNLVTQSILNFLCEMPKSQSTPSPKVIALSTSGVSRSSRAQTPFLLKPVYGYLITHPAQDKLGMERVIWHCAGWEWNTKVDGEPTQEVMGPGTEWMRREGLPAPCTLNNAVVLRAALLNDGDCRGDEAKVGGKQPYRIGEGEVGGMFVSRKDVAHFIFELVTKRWDELGGKQISIAY